MVRVLDQVVIEQASRASSHQLLPAVDHDAERMLHRDLLVNIPERQLAAVRQPVVHHRLRCDGGALGDQASVLKQAAVPEMSLGEAGMAVEDSAVERLAKCGIRRFHAALLKKTAPGGPVPSLTPWAEEWNGSARNPPRWSGGRSESARRRSACSSRPAPRAVP